MWGFRIHQRLFLVFVILSLHLLCISTTDELCRHPPHEANEKITFSNSFMNNTFPENTIASYYCENSTIENSFKFATCGANQTWAFQSLSDVNCSIEPSNRCQRMSKIGISPSLKSLVFEKTCFSLHRGINDTTLENFEDECDIGIFRATESNDELGLYQYEIKQMCNMFLVTNEYQKSTRKILIALKPKKSDSSWRKRFTSWIKKLFSSSESGDDPPECYYLECPSNKKYSTINVEVCDPEQNYWICKHNVTSCGIPSRPVHTILEFSGIQVGANATYQCEEGYVSDTSLKRKCKKRGFWSDHPPTCRPVDCGKPEVKENVTYELVTKNQTTYRSWLKHICILPHQTINGSEYRMCLANGSWEGESPVCQSSPGQLTEDDASTSHFLENSLGLNPGEAELLQLNIGIIAGITLFLIALMWSVFGVLLWRDKRKRKLDESASS